MPRRLLTDAEREERRIARNKHTFSDAAYRHYDPATEGYGNKADWSRIAEGLAFGRGVLKRVNGNNTDLALLGIDRMPLDIKGLKRAFHRRLHVVHPDHQGGSDAATKDLLAAYGRLCEHY